MKLSEYKGEATLTINGERLTGLAHVFELEYRDDLHFCNFVMQTTTDEMKRMGQSGQAGTLGTPCSLELKNGREALVTLFGAEVSTSYSEVRGAGTFSNR